MTAVRPVRRRLALASLRRPATPGREAARGGLWRALRLASLALAAAYLVALHAELLWQRIASQTLLEPLVALRWLGAVGLVAGLAWMRRSGIPVWRGRRAVVFWMLVLLLHAGTAVPAAGELAADLADAAGPGLLLVLPLCATLATVFEFGRRLLERRLAVRPVSRPTPRWLTFEGPPQLALAHGFGRVLASRPPPR